MKQKFATLSGFVGSLILGLLLLGGVPVLLVAVVGNPLPSSVPTLAEMQDLLTQNGQNFGLVLSSTLAIFIWIVWAQLVVALIVELVSTLRRVEAGRLPVLPGIQNFAARVIAGLALAAALSAPVAGAVGPALSAVVVAPGPDAVAAQVDSPPEPVTTATWIADGSVSQAQPAEVVATDSDDEDFQGAKLTVHSETDLWMLAERVYGDGPAWRAIAADNNGALDSMGHRIDESTTSISAGTTIILNEAANLDQTVEFGTIERETDEPDEAGRDEAGPDETGPDEEHDDSEDLDDAVSDASNQTGLEESGHEEPRSDDSDEDEDEDESLAAAVADEELEDEDEPLDDGELAENAEVPIWTADRDTELVASSDHEVADGQSEVTDGDDEEIDALLDDEPLVVWVPSS